MRESATDLCKVKIYDTNTIRPTIAFTASKPVFVSLLVADFQEPFPDL
jgi:hypothetical protein